MLVERDEPLQTVVGRLAQDRGATVITGPAGIGKTALAERVVAELASSAQVCRARPTHLERGLSHAVTLELLDALVATADGAIWSGAAAGARALFEPGVGTLPEGLALVHALHDLCLRLSDDRRLVLFVDDVQWADRESVEFLGYLASRTSPNRIAILLTARTEEADLRHGAAQELLDLRDVGSVDLAPLSENGAAVLLRALTEEVTAEQISDWWRRSGGVPLFLRELLRRDQDEGPAPRSDTVLNLVQARLRRQPAHVRRVAVCLAVLGARASVDEVAHLAELDVETTLVVLDALVAAGLVVDPITALAHPVFAEAVLEAAPRGDIARLRRRAAHGLHVADPQRAAAQLVATDPPVPIGEPWAASVLEQAARRALHRGGTNEAARYLELALEEPAPRSLRREILAALACIQARRRDDRALDLFGEAAALADEPVDQASIALLHGEALFHLSELDECARMCLDASVALEESDRELSLTLHAMAFSAAGISGNYPRSPSELLDEVATGDTTAERSVLAHVVYEAAASGSWSQEHVRDVGGRALGGGVLLDSAGAGSPAHIYCGIALAWADEFDLVIDHTERAVEIGARTGSRMAIAYATALQAWAFLRSGRLADAEQSARRVIDELGDADAMSYGVSVACLVQALVDAGRAEEAQATLVDTGMDGDLPPLSTVAFLVLARGHLRLAQGRAREAVTEFELVRDMAGGDRYRNPAALAWRSALARAHLALGNHDRATENALAEVQPARRFGAGRALSIALRTQAACEQRESRRTALLREAAEQAGRAGAHLEQARALTDLGRVVMGTDAARARPVLAEAADLADRCGAASLGDDVHRLIVSCGGRPRRPRIRGVESLTRQERRIATLAATGLRNREIAAELFVTMATVESHLTNVYRKLDIRARSELPTAMSTEPD